MSNQQHPILQFWYALNELYKNMSDEDFNAGFNRSALKKAEELGLDANQIDSTLSAWACTIQVHPPVHFLKRHNIQP